MSCKCKTRPTRDEASQFFAEKIGRKQHVTPEGFLLIEDVPIARTGKQIYGPDETPIKPGSDGLAHVDREPEEVFRPETIASFEGKDVVNDHPSEGVNPDNWRYLTVGHVQNVHRGAGAEDNFLFGDILIKDAAAIAAVREGKREVSCGYDAQYEQTGPGRGRQFNIVGNHVALVDKGRCGPRCSIGDGERKMAKRTVKDRLMKLLNVKDAAEFEQAISEPLEGGIDDEGAMGGHRIEIHNHMPGAAAAVEGDAQGEMAAEGGTGGGDLPPWFTAHVTQNNERFDKLEGMISKLSPAATDEAANAENKEIEGALKEEAPAGTGDEAVKAKDSAFLADSFQDTAALAEIIIPGIRIPTFDKASSPKITLDAICALRRQALDLAYVQPVTRGMIDDALAGRPFDSKAMTCDALRTVFRAVGAMKKRANNAASHDASGTAAGKPVVGARIHSIGDLNDAYKKHYGRAAG